MPFYPPKPEDTLSTFELIPVEVGTAPAIVLPANLNRKQATFYNYSDSETIYIDFAPMLSADNAVFKIEPKQVYVSDIQWNGDVYAVTRNGTATLFIREIT